MTSPIINMVDQACGITPEMRQQWAEQAKQSAALVAVADAAKAWWESNRPTTYSEEQHLHNPTVNCNGGADNALALAIAELVAYGW